MPFDYYVRADGTASKDDATGPPSDPSKAMSLETFNASSFAPGDRIGFSDQGGDFQGQLVVPSGGTADNPIVYAGVSGETPVFGPEPGATDQHSVLVRNVSHVELENLSGHNQGESSVFRFDGNSQDIVARDLHVLGNRSLDGTQGGDGFSLDGSAEVVFHDITARATGQLPDSGPPESDQAITTHGTSKAWVYGFNFADAEGWAVAVGESELRLYDGVARDAQQESFRANGDALVEVHRSDILIDGTAKFGSGSNQHFIDSDITITGGRISLLTGQTTISGGTLTVDSATWRIQTLSPDAVLRLQDSQLNITDVNGNMVFIGSAGGNLQVDGISVEGPASADRFVKFSATVAGDQDSWIRDSDFSDFASSELISVSELFQGSLEISGNSFQNTPQGGGGVVDEGSASQITVVDNTFINILNPLAVPPTAVVAGNTFQGDQGNNSLTATIFDDLLLGLGGNDTLSGDAGNDTLEGGTGADELLGGNGRDTASYENAAQAVTARLSAPQHNKGDADGDTYASIENITGSAFSDLIYGDASGNVLSGGDGNDRIFGGGGNDSVFGGEGNDRFYAHSGTTHFDGGNGLDIVDYSAAGAAVAVDLAAGTGTSGLSQDMLVNVEQAAGSAFNDQLTGNGADNRLFGRNGDDLLEGLSGSDTLYGGAGDDSLRGGSEADALFGGDGSDTADYSSANEGLTVRLGMATRNTGEASGDSFHSIENIAGSAFNDLLYGDDGDNVIGGGAGNDRLMTGAGDDQLFGGSGKDRAYIQTGDNLFDGGEGEDIVDYAFAAGPAVVDLATGSASSAGSNDQLVSVENAAGGNLNDALSGDVSDNLLQGRQGNDTLQGRAGDDDLYGGTGDDRFIFEVGDGDDTIWDFSVTPGDSDLVVLIGFDQGALGGHPVDTAEQIGNHVRIDLGASQSLVLRNFDVEDLSEDLFLFS